MVNLRKCKFLTENAAILGLELNAVGFALGVEFIGNLHEVIIPTDLKGLQGLGGKLMDASPHVPHYKEHAKPIEAHCRSWEMSGGLKSVQLQSTICYSIYMHV